MKKFLKNILPENSGDEEITPLCHFSALKCRKAGRPNPVDTLRSPPSISYLAFLTQLAQYHYKEAVIGDIPAVARLRREAGESHLYWEHRISAYLTGVHNPQKALPRRVLFIAEYEGRMAGFVAGHLTQRFGFQGELQWIHVGMDFRRSGMALKLLEELVGWFQRMNALRVCVNVAPENMPAQTFYRKHGAVDFQSCWLCWENISIITEKKNFGGSD